MNIYKHNIDFQSVLQDLFDYFQNVPRDIIINNFCHELLITGWNVCKAVEEYDVIPHVFNDHMITLYTYSDAFIYECTVGGLEINKINKDKFILNKIKKNYHQDQLNILCFGDGVGLDSKIHAENGHRITYFDFEGPTSKFAQHYLSTRGLIEKVEFVFKEEEILLDNYDIVICREILEHLENPINTMQDLWKYLNKDGICFLSESFSRVEDRFPTHLATNLRYAGKTIELMVKAGFRYLDRFGNTNLLVFKKTEKNDKFRFETIPTIPLKRRLKKGLRNKLMYYLS